MKHYCILVAVLMALVLCTAAAQAATLFLPEGTKRIEAEAFYGDKAFADCGKLSAVRLNDGLECISYGAFSGCTALKMITIPSTVVSVLDGAFQNCTALTTTSFMSGPKFGRSVFANCSALTA